MTLYHVTNVKYLESIFKVGLVPDIGFLSYEANEPWAAIYLFKELDANFEKDVDRWLIWAHARKNMALLKVTLPDNFGGLTERFDWEVVCTKTIPPEYIEQIPYSFEPERRGTHL